MTVVILLKWYLTWNKRNFKDLFKTDTMLRPLTAIPNVLFHLICLVKILKTLCNKRPTSFFFSMNISDVNLFKKSINSKSLKSKFILKSYNLHTWFVFTYIWWFIYTYINNLVCMKMSLTKDLLSRTKTHTTMPDTGPLVVQTDWLLNRREVFTNSQVYQKEKRMKD